MGRQEPRRLGQVLSAGRHQPGGAPAVLRLSVPDGGGRLHSVTTQQWAERTPDNFVFNVYAFRLFTGSPLRL